MVESLVVRTQVRFFGGGFPNKPEGKNIYWLLRYKLYFSIKNMMIYTLKRKLQYNILMFLRIYDYRLKFVWKYTKKIQFKPVQTSPDFYPPLSGCKWGELNEPFLKFNLESWINSRYDPLFANKTLFSKLISTMFIFFINWTTSRLQFTMNFIIFSFLLFGRLTTKDTQWLL